MLGPPGIALGGSPAPLDTAERVRSPAVIHHPAAVAQCSAPLGPVGHAGGIPRRPNATPGGAAPAIFPAITQQAGGGAVSRTARVAQAPARVAAAAGVTVDGIVHPGGNQRGPVTQSGGPTVAGRSTGPHRVSPGTVATGRAP